MLPVRVECGLQELSTHVVPQLVQLLSTGGVWMFLEGELGAGKTTLVQHLVHALGGREEATSPTFTIVNQYSMPHNAKEIFHLDLYRLKRFEELQYLGLDVQVHPHSIVFCEWGSLFNATEWNSLFAQFGFFKSVLLVRITKTQNGEKRSFEISHWTGSF